MDKIWVRNPSKSLAVVAGWKTKMAMQNRQKSNAKNKLKELLSKKSSILND